MPNIVYLWDFEDGTTQGWSLGGYTSLDSSGTLQGTYCLAFIKLVGSTRSYTDFIASISGIDLSSVARPLLLILIKDNSSNYYLNRPHRLRIIIKDGTTVYIDKSIYVSYDKHNYTRIVALDLSSVAGKSGLIIELYENSYNDASTSYTARHYYDMIAIIDGADYEYNTGVVINDNEDKTLEVDVPTADGDLSGIATDRFGVCLVTPDWQYSTMSAEAVTDQGSAEIDSSKTDIKNINYKGLPTSPDAFQKLVLFARVSIGAYDGWLEKIAVVFLDSLWNYKRIYLFNVYYTANGISPRFASSVNTTTYGSTVSGSKDINVRIHGTSLQVALKVKYLVGDPSIVPVGSVKLTVYNSDKTTNYGSVEIDLTVGSEQTSTYITGLPTDTDLIFTIEWSITANARVVLLIYPLVKVS